MSPELTRDLNNSFLICAGMWIGDNDIAQAMFVFLLLVAVYYAYDRLFRKAA